MRRKCQKCLCLSTVQLQARVNRGFKKIQNKPLKIPIIQMKYLEWNEMDSWFTISSKSGESSIRKNVGTLMTWTML